MLVYCPKGITQMKTWHYREFLTLKEVTGFANDRQLAPGEIILGPKDGMGNYQVMYFAEKY